MSAGWLSRLRGKGEQKPLQSDLKVLTESNVMEVPKETLTMVVESTKLGEEERKEIMAHLRSCLAEPSGRLWRRMYAGLLLTEELLKSGAPELWVETAEGQHFDIVQRLSLLEKFECTNDTRVQVMVRNKAGSLRTKTVRCLDHGGEMASDPSAADEPGSKATKSSPSSGSSAGASKSSSTTASYSSSSSLQPEYKTEGQMVLNGIVTVGHNDDTDSGDSGDDGGYRKAVAYRQTKQASVSSAAVRSPPSPADAKVASHSAPAPEVDLLGGFDAPCAPSQEVDLLAASPAKPPQEVDLLGF